MVHMVVGTVGGKEPAALACAEEGALVHRYLGTMGYRLCHCLLWNGLGFANKLERLVEAVGDKAAHMVEFLQSYSSDLVDVAESPAWDY